MIAAPVTPINQTDSSSSLSLVEDQCQLIACDDMREARMTLNFWKFWSGQAISRLGTSFTSFALPLLVFRLTGSAFNLALSSAAYFLPYLLFGLFIGAWVDRSNRKRTMIMSDLARALILLSIPFLAATSRLTVWWIYLVTFLASALSIFFSTAEFAAIPSLVQSRKDLVSANGRIQASYSAATIIGPLLAGLLTSFFPLPSLLILDSASFLVSATMVSLIDTSFNVASAEAPPRSLVRTLADGLRYVWRNPILRSLSLMIGLVNFVSSTVNAQLVFFAKRQLSATNSEIGLLFSAGSAGVVALSLTAGLLRKRWSFSQVALGALALIGLLTVTLSLTHRYRQGLILWALIYGFTSLFNINAASLRQAITPNELLGRVMSIAQVLAWSAIPLGSLLGGLAIERLGDTAPVFAAIGILVTLIAIAFSFSPVGRANEAGR